MTVKELIEVLQTLPQEAVVIKDQNGLDGDTMHLDIEPDDISFHVFARLNEYDCEEFCHRHVGKYEPIKAVVL